MFYSEGAVKAFQAAGRLIARYPVAITAVNCTNHSSLGRLVNINEGAYKTRKVGNSEDDLAADQYFVIGYNGHQNCLVISDNLKCIIEVGYSSLEFCDEN